MFRHFYLFVLKTTSIHGGEISMPLTVCFKLSITTVFMHTYTTGASKELDLHAQTVHLIAAEHVTRRKQFKQSKLSWRKHSGVRWSLGWGPFNTGAAQWNNGHVYFKGQYYSYGLSK